MKMVFDGYGSKETGNNCVIIDVSFNTGGMNWFNGNQEDKGYWGYFTVGQRTEFGSIRTIPTESFNFKIKLLSTERRNKKTEEKLFNLISTKEIADLVWNKEKYEVYNLIKTILS